MEARYPASTVDHLRVSGGDGVLVALWNVAVLADTKPVIINVEALQTKPERLSGHPREYLGHGAALYPELIKIGPTASPDEKA